MVTGEIVTLGRHRLMCGDAGNPEHVAALMAGAKPDLVFTSPPYAQQRNYVSGIGDWDTLMQRVFGAMPHHEKTQVLVNLGLVHRKGEWVPYWDGWIEWMRTQGWRRFGWYVWDKQEAMCGDWHGRLAPCFEFVFHFNRAARQPNKVVLSKWFGKATMHGKNMKSANGDASERSQAGKPISEFKINDAMLRVTPDKANRTGHPAVFPVALPAEIILAYTDPGGVVYDPFCGSGTTILAAEREGRVCYAMEIEPSYVQIAVERFRALQPSLPGAA